VAKRAPRTAAEATAQLDRATKQWRTAKKHERDARDALALIVVDVVGSGTLSENKVSRLTEIPRMTIRKMLGKS
jgi:class 3 adenylate cyclase